MITTLISGICEHCGGKLFPDEWDYDLQTCVNCGRQTGLPNPLPLLKERPWRSKEFKRKVVETAVRLGNDEEAARAHGVCAESVRNWRKEHHD